MGAVLDGEGYLTVYGASVTRATRYTMRFRHDAEAWTYAKPSKVPMGRIRIMFPEAITIQLRAERGMQRSEWSGIRIEGYNQQ